MSKVEHFEKKPKYKKGRNFYIALGICLIAVGITSWTTYNNFTKSNSPKNQVVSEKKNEPDFNFEEEKRKIKNYEEEKKVPDKKEDIKVNAKKVHEEKPLIIYPSSKDVIKAYSGDNPVYSKTFNDWRAHLGVDFAAEQGAKIKSISNGKVLDIYEDPLLGNTMVIEHEGGFKAFYSGLGDTTMVNKDDQVESGQEIASINDIPSEILDGYHLHLAIKKDDKFINPIDILGEN